MIRCLASDELHVIGRLGFHVGEAGALDLVLGGARGDFELDAAAVVIAAHLTPRAAHTP